jgi:hypothetical protein
MQTTEKPENSDAAGSALKPMLGAWIPIADQSPNAGKMVLACYKNSADKWRIICAYWIPAKFREADAESEIGEYDEATDTYYDPAGWYERIDNWSEYGAVVVTEGEVSHWMSMPAPPGI